MPLDATNITSSYYDGKQCRTPPTLHCSKIIVNIGFLPVLKRAVSQVIRTQNRLNNERTPPKLMISYDSDPPGANTPRDRSRDTTTINLTTPTYHHHHLYHHHLPSSSPLPLPPTSTIPITTSCLRHDMTWSWSWSWPWSWSWS